MLFIINKVLDFSKIDGGRLTLQKLELAPRDTIEAAVDLHSGVPERVLGDSTRLQQVLLNLLSNAVKSAASGWIKVAATPPITRRYGGTGPSLAICRRIVALMG